MLIKGRIYDLPKRVVVHPTSVTMPAGEDSTYQFTASVYNTSQKALEWTIISGGGFIDADTGLYYGPSGIVPATTTVVIQAALKIDPSVYGRATITIEENRAITVTVTRVDVYDNFIGDIHSMSEFVQRAVLYPDEVEGGITGWIHSSVVTGDSYAIADSVPIYSEYWFEASTVNATGGTEYPEISGYIISNSYTNLATRLENLDNVVVVYPIITSRDDYATCPGWPANVTTTSPEGVVIGIDTSYLGGGGDLHKEYTLLWRRGDDMLTWYNCPTGMVTAMVPGKAPGGQVIIFNPNPIDINGDGCYTNFHSFNITTRDVVKPDLALYNYSSNYEFNDEDCWNFYIPIATPSSAVDYITVDMTDSWQTETIPVYYMPYMESASPPSGSVGTEITLYAGENGRFYDDMNFIINDTHVINNFTITDGNYLTFILPDVNMLGAIDLKIQWKSFEYSNYGVYLTADFPKFFIVV